MQWMAPQKPSNREIASAHHSKTVIGDASILGTRGAVNTAGRKKGRNPVLIKGEDLIARSRRNSNRVPRAIIVTLAS